MRDLLTSMLLAPFGGRTNADHWAELRAGEIFAEHFRDDRELRGRVIDAFNANPENESCGRRTGRAIAPRRGVLGLTELLTDKVRGRRYNVGTHFKLMAALAPSDVLVEFIVEILARDIEPDNWSLPYWTPALVRRAKLDRELREQMFSALVGASTVSLKVTLLSLLSRGMGLTDDLRQYATDELAQTATRGMHQRSDLI